MITNDLPRPNAGPQRIAYAHASSLLLARALTEAHERLARHFPALTWPTWGEVLRQLQPDVLVTGNAVTFDWHTLARWVQCLAASPGRPAPSRPVALPAPATAQKRRSAPRRNAPRRRTFRDIVQKHPRANGTFGFRVRELCITMHISTASLTEARANPGRLSVNAVVALAEAMGECPLRVLTDLMAEAATKRKNGKRGPNGRSPTP